MRIVNTPIGKLYCALGLSKAVLVKKDEEFTNEALARLLTERGVPADFERRTARKKMDVVADVNGLRVVLEAETGFHRKAQAIKDADARLRQGLTTVVFAVCYPEDVTQSNLPGATLTWTLRLKPGEPVRGWAEGGIDQLTRAVQQAPNSLSGSDFAAQLLSDSLDAMVQRLKIPVRRSIAQALDLPPTRKKGGDEQDRYFVAAKRGMLVVATAMLFHQRVQEYLPADAPDGYDGLWPPATVTECTGQPAPINAFREAWLAILAVDYRPVFETGRIALEALSIDLDTAQGLRSLAKVVTRVAELVSGLRHDLLGRIFHRVLDTARYDGSFYTSTAAAVLLATLALREGDSDWSDPNAVAGLRICDPACGTGTLLMAAAERIRDLRNASGRAGYEDEEALGLVLVEDVLWGYDINLTATHMAASTLGMLSPSTSFARMNIYRTLLGVVNGKPHLGSLDLLDDKMRLVRWPSATRQVDEDLDNGANPPVMDLVIMNPPFTRDSLRHDQFTSAHEKAIKQREKDMLKGQPYKGAARLSGSANAFMVLSERMLHEDKGIVAVVLPTVMATNPAASQTRKYLAGSFHIDAIVSSHDPQRIFFSENTSIGEVLLVCRRWDKEKPKPPTRVINLARNPASPIDALDTAARIEQVTESGAKASHDFTIQRADADRIERGDWFAVNFLSPFLVDAYRTLTEKNPFSVSTVTLKALAEVGPEGRRIRDSYTTSEMPTNPSRRALWHHKTDITQSMRAKTDTYIEPKPPKRKLADKYWEQRSNLLLPHRLRLNVARVAAVMLDEKAVGSIWTPCRASDPALAKAICLYLNSTVGLLTLLGGRDNRVPSYPSFSLDTLRSLPIPDFTSLGEAELNLMDGWFDWLQNEPLQPLPNMHEDPVRHQIDDAVVKALGLDADWIATIRRELAREPSVTDRRS